MVLDVSANLSKDLPQWLTLAAARDNTGSPLVSTLILDFSDDLGGYAKADGLVRLNLGHAAFRGAPFPESSQELIASPPNTAKQTLAHELVHAHSLMAQNKDIVSWRSIEVTSRHISIKPGSEYERYMFFDEGPAYLWQAKRSLVSLRECRKAALSQMNENKPICDRELQEILSQALSLTGRLACQTGSLLDGQVSALLPQISAKNAFLIVKESARDGSELIQLLTAHLQSSPQNFHIRTARAAKGSRMGPGIIINLPEQIGGAILFDLEQTSYGGVTYCALHARGMRHPFRSSGIQIRLPSPAANELFEDFCSVLERFDRPPQSEEKRMQTIDAVLSLWKSMLPQFNEQFGQAMTDADKILLKLDLINTASSQFYANLARVSDYLSRVGSLPAAQLCTELLQGIDGLSRLLRKELPHPRRMRLPPNLKAMKIQAVNPEA